MNKSGTYSTTSSSNDVIASMSDNTMFMGYINGDSKIGQELGLSIGSQGAAVVFFRGNNWRISAMACSLDGTFWYGYSTSQNGITWKDLRGQKDISSSTNILTLLPGVYSIEGDAGTIKKSNGFPYDNTTYTTANLHIYGKYTDANNGYKVIELAYEGNKYVRRQKWDTWDGWKQYTLTNV